MAVIGTGVGVGVTIFGVIIDTGVGKAGVGVAGFGVKVGVVAGVTVDVALGREAWLVLAASIAGA